MGQTITEKILSRVVGRPVKAGEDVMAKPDFVLSYDFPGYTDLVFKQMKEDFGIDKVPDPERYAIFIDHMIPAATPAEEELHIGTRKWCAENNVALYERVGIGHQVGCEMGYAVPGAGIAQHFRPADDHRPGHVHRRHHRHRQSL